MNHLGLVRCIDFKEVTTVEAIQQFLEGDIYFLEWIRDTVTGDLEQADFLYRFLSDDQENSPFISEEELSPAEMTSIVQTMVIEAIKLLFDAEANGLIPLDGYIYTVWDDRAWDNGSGPLDTLSFVAEWDEDLLGAMKLPHPNKGQRALALIHQFHGLMEQAELIAPPLPISPPATIDWSA